MFAKFGGKKRLSKCWEMRIACFISRNLSDLNNCVISAFLHSLVNIGKPNMYIYGNHKAQDNF